MDDDKLDEIVRNMRVLIWAKTGISYFGLNPKNPWMWSFTFLPKSCVLSGDAIWLQLCRKSYILGPEHPVYLSNAEAKQRQDNGQTLLDQYHEVVSIFLPPSSRNKDDI